jgi:peptidoglycan/xylan/chitin deacetylase (PgdA/CDA1 family)
MARLRLALKIDVDTERGTRVGVPALCRALGRAGAPAAFYFSLGPDHTGRSIRRVFRRGFLGKASRTNVLALYGLRTLLYGVLLPGPQIAKRHADGLRAVRAAGFEVGIHCWDHVRWQDGLARMSAEQAAGEFERAREAFERVFRTPAASAAAAGWQADAHSLEAYDRASLEYASDTRGHGAFFPRCGERVFRTLQIPTTLPTLDELLGRPGYEDDALIPAYLGWLVPDALNVLTLHAEIEGMSKLGWFEALLAALRAEGVELVALGDLARELRAAPESIPTAELLQGSVEGRSGTLAIQGR